MFTFHLLFNLTLQLLTLSFGLTNYSTGVNVCTNAGSERGNSLLQMRRKSLTNNISTLHTDLFLKYKETQFGMVFEVKNLI